MKARPGGDKDVEETEPVAEDDGHALIRWCRARRPPDVVGRRPEPRRPVSLSPTTLQPRSES